MSCDEISADWAAQRIKGLDLGVAVMDAFGGRSACRRTRAGERQDPDRTFQYPRRGPGMMWEAAARKIEAQGGL